jgi:16S rRNA (cytidine1402-2'-O)-methyltransferase
LPGPSAALVAAAASGLVAERFLFEGYLSKTRGKRVNTLKYLNSTGSAAIIFENPTRVIRTLYDIMSVYGKEVRVYLGVELTKLHEKNIRGTVKEIIDKLENMDKVLKGEVTIVVEGQKLTDEELEERKTVREFNREVNIITAVKYLVDEYGIPNKEIRKIMKNAFH